MSATTHFPPYWRERLLAVVGAKPHAENLRFLGAWAVAEGGDARWNPLNTTMPLPGATNYNSVGVKNYARPTEGVCATAITLVNGHYGRILGHLQAEAGVYTAEQIVNACRDQIGVWGTNPDVILRELG